MLKRATMITYTIIGGADILQRGHETARHLWNQLWWHQIGHNEKMRRVRGDSWEVYRRNLPHNRGEKYLGGFGMQKAIKDEWCAVELADRCFSYTVKDFDIAMRSWFANVRGNPQARPPRYSKKPRILNFEIGRNAKPVGEWTYRLTVLGGSIPNRHAFIKLHIRPGVKMRDIKLLRLQPGGDGVVIYGFEPNETTGAGFAAVDLGIINIATIAFDSGESIMVSGKGLLAAQQWGQKQAAKCKPKNWTKGKQQEGQSKKFKQYRRKAANIQKLAVHNLSRFIVDECIKRNIGTLVIGDLKGIREDADHGKAGNQKSHNWPFAEIRRQLEYKCQETGIELVAVSERNTSKCCHRCGEKGARNPRGLLTCKTCKVVINSDVNGAFGILNKVSPAPAKAGVGVEAVFPGLPSPPAAAAGIVKVSQIHPTFAAKFDLRNWSVIQARCN